MQNAFQLAEQVVGRTLDIDGAWGGQCVDLALYIAQKYGTWLNGNANQLHLTPGLSQYADILPPTAQLRVGDLIITSGGLYGHVSVYGGGPITDALQIDQNYAGKQVVQKHRYSIPGVGLSIIALIRFKAQDNYTPTGADGQLTLNSDEPTLIQRDYEFYEVTCATVNAVVGAGSNEVVETFYQCNKVTGVVDNGFLRYQKHNGKVGYIPLSCLKRKEDYDVHIQETSDGSPVNKYQQNAKKTRDGLSQSGTQALYSLQEFMRLGRIKWGNFEWTWYSQEVLPGGGLQIPGRHVNAYGYVCDGDGYIVLAAPDSWGNVKGNIYDTPFGFKGKVYDVNAGGNALDVYISETVASGQKPTGTAPVTNSAGENQAPTSNNASKRSFSQAPQANQEKADKPKKTGRQLRKERYLRNQRQVDKIAELRKHKLF